MTTRNFEGISPTIHSSAYIDESALVIGDVRIGEESSIWPFTVIRGDVQSIRIGKRTNIQDGCVLHVTHGSEYSGEPEGLPLLVGNDTTVGHKAVLHACTIQDYCLIGMGSIVMDGAIIEDHVMVGAGSLVPPGKVLKSGYLWLGSPVKRVRKLSNKEHTLLSYSAQH